MVDGPITVTNAPWFDLSVDDMENGGIAITQNSAATGHETVIVDHASVPGLIAALQEFARG